MMKVLLRNESTNHNWHIIINDSITLVDYVKNLASCLRTSSLNRLPFALERSRNWARFDFQETYEVPDYIIDLLSDKQIEIFSETGAKIFSGNPNEFTKPTKPKTGDIVQFTYLSAGKNPSFKCVQVKQSDHNSFEGFDLSQPVGSAYRKFKLDRVQGEIKLVK